MTKRYLLNSAVITAPGRYDYRLISAEEARAWASSAPWTSAIGYEQTAQALTILLGQQVSENRTVLVMQPGDEALVFRLAFLPGTPRIDPQDKGRLAQEVLGGHFELGLLTRLT